MSLRSAAALAKGLADDTERAVTAANRFPGLPGGGTLAAGGGGANLAQLQAALAPVLAGLDTIQGAITGTAGEGFLMARRFGG